MGLFYCLILVLSSFVIEKILYVTFIVVLIGNIFFRVI